MLSVIRKSSAMVLLESNQVHQVEEKLRRLFKGVPVQIEDALSHQGEKTIIIFLMKKLKNPACFDDADFILAVQNNPTDFLIEILNSDLHLLIQKVRLAPQLLVMHIEKNFPSVLKSITDNFSVEQGSLLPLWEKHSSGTLLSFTNHHLNCPLSLEDLYPTCLYFSEHPIKILHHFHLFALEYLNTSMDHKEWIPLDIKIYDNYSAYDLHYRRLIHILESLNMGLVLGEYWDEDNLSLFRFVEVYQIHLYTYLDKFYIKKILLGMEYLEDGTRIVDYDLFYHRKKIDWTEVKRNPQFPKIKLSNIIRNEILSELNTEQKEELFRLEDKIQLSRQN